MTRISGIRGLRGLGSRGLGFRIDRLNAEQRGVLVWGLGLAVEVQCCVG